MLSNQDTFYLLRGPTWKCPHASVPASASISTLVMFRRCWLMDSSTPRLNKPSLWVCLQLTSDKLHANKLNETVASLATVTSLWLKMAEVKTMEMWGERPPQECPTYIILQSYHILSCIYIYVQAINLINSSFKKRTSTNLEGPIAYQPTTHLHKNYVGGHRWKEHK